MTAVQSHLVSLVESGFGHPQVLVVGDVMLDKYVWGDVERISPEAPVPVLRARSPERAARRRRQRRHESRRTWGPRHADRISAVAMTISTLSKPSCAQAGVEFSIVACPGTSTTTKLRVLAGHQQLLRMDCEAKPSHSATSAEILLRAGCMLALPDASVVVLSDYAQRRLERAGLPRHHRGGASTSRARRGRSQGDRLCTLSRRDRDLSEREGIGGGHGRIRQRSQAVASGRTGDGEAALDLEYLLVTLSEKGIAILRPDSRVHVPPAARQVYDVSGAGDTVVAVVAAALASGVPIEAAVRLANVAAGIVISKVGTVPIQRGELLGALSQELPPGSEEKVIPLGAAVGAGRRMAVARTARGVHQRLLRPAAYRTHRAAGTGAAQGRPPDRRGQQRQLGAPTEGARASAGASRTRARILAALAAVDAVVVFDESTPLRLIEAMRPDVLVKGGDYTEDEVVGAAEVRGWGGRVELVPLVHGCSTTNLIERSDALECRREHEHGAVALLSANSDAARHFLAQAPGANGAADEDCSELPGASSSSASTNWATWC